MCGSIRVSNLIENQEAIVAWLRAQVPGLLAIYAFGSRVQGHARADSDLDMAVLVEGYANPVQLWQWAADLQDLAGCSVDLRAASTVMQHQILTTGVRCWALDIQAALFECAMLTEKLHFDEARAGLLQDIYQRGTVYGR